MSPRSRAGRRRIGRRLQNRYFRPNCVSFRSTRWIAVCLWTKMKSRVNFHHSWCFLASKYSKMDSGLSKSRFSKRRVLKLTLWLANRHLHPWFRLFWSLCGVCDCFPAQTLSNSIPKHIQKASKHRRGPVYGSSIHQSGWFRGSTCVHSRSSLRT